MFKILHTSDWHLGARLFKRCRYEEHQAFLSFLLATLETRKIDALMICGDLFHTPYPDHASLKLYYEFLSSMLQTPCKQAVIIAGNHDSPTLLEGPARLLRNFDIHIAARGDSPPIYLKKEGVAQAIVAPIPFLRPAFLPLNEEEGNFCDYSLKVRAQIKNFYARYWEQLPQKNPLPIIGTGHLFVQEKSSDDTSLLFGESHTMTPLELPRPFDYFALGHLHTCHFADREETVGYPGSPIPLNFEEGKTPRYLLEVGFEGKRLASIEKIQAPQKRELVTLKGDFKSIEQQIEKIDLSDPIPFGELIFSEMPPSDFFHAKVKELIDKTKNLEILKYEIPNKNTSFQLNPTLEAQNLETLSPYDVFTELLKSEGILENKEELAPFFDRLLAEAAL